MEKRLGSILLACVAATCVAAIPSAATGQAARSCSLVASPSGSDSAPGTLAAPFQTVQRLVDSLRPGQTGCLGTGSSNGTSRSRDPGTTLTSYPGQTATIVGRMYVAEGANDTTVAGLDLNGDNPGQELSPVIDANHVTFSYDDVTNDHTGTCFGIGSATWGWSTGTVITHDRIHACGQEFPGDNLQHRPLHRGGHRHDDRVEPDLNNAARGIQLYPEALDTTIAHNIIDDNGEGILIAGTNGVASSYTNVYDNIISDATQRHDVESYWPAGNPSASATRSTTTACGAARESHRDRHLDGRRERHRQPRRESSVPRCQCRRLRASARAAPVSRSSGMSRRRLTEPRHSTR